MIRYILRNIRGLFRILSGHDPDYFRTQFQGIEDYGKKLSERLDRYEERLAFWEQQVPSMLDALLEGLNKPVGRVKERTVLMSPRGQFGGFEGDKVILLPQSEPRYWTPKTWHPRLNSSWADYEHKGKWASQPTAIMPVPPIFYEKDWRSYRMLRIVFPPITMVGILLASI